MKVYGLLIFTRNLEFIGRGCIVDSHGPILPHLLRLKGSAAQFCVYWVVPAVPFPRYADEFFKLSVGFVCRPRAIILIRLSLAASVLVSFASLVFVSR